MMVAEDRLLDAQIAEEIGARPSTLRDWKVEPLFRQRVEELRQAWRERVMQEGIANQTKRLEAINDRWRRGHQVIQE